MSTTMGWAAAGLWMMAALIGASIVSVKWMWWIKTWLEGNPTELSFLKVCESFWNMSAPKFHLKQLHRIMMFSKPASKIPSDVKMKGGDRLLPTIVRSERFNPPRPFMAHDGTTVNAVNYGTPLCVPWALCCTSNVKQTNRIVMFPHVSSCHFEPFPGVALPQFVSSGTWEVQAIPLKACERMWKDIFELLNPKTP